MGSPEAKRLRETRRHLRELVSACTKALEDMDRIGPSLLGKLGTDLADVANRLNLARDAAEHFGLGLPLRGAKKGARRG